MGDEWGWPTCDELGIFVTHRIARENVNVDKVRKVFFFTYANYALQFGFPSSSSIAIEFVKFQLLHSSTNLDFQAHHRSRLSLWSSNYFRAGPILISKLIAARNWVCEVLIAPQSGQFNTRRFQQMRFQFRFVQSMVTRTSACDHCLRHDWMLLNIQKAPGTALRKILRCNGYGYFKP